MIGLGALAALTIGGILVKRRLDVKAAEKLAKRASELLQKPEEFTKDTLKSIAAEWDNAGKLADGDKIILMGKTLMDEFAAKDAKWSKLYKAMKMSDNGLMVVLQKADGKIDESTYKYFTMTVTLFTSFKSSTSFSPSDGVSSNCSPVSSTGSTFSIGLV